MAQSGISRFYVTPFSSPPFKPDAPRTQRRYHYLDYPPRSGIPQKATLLLLHGFPDYSSTWHSVASLLSLSGYRLIVPDLLGFGLSSAPPTSSNAPGGSRLAEYSFRSICTDLNGLLDHAKAGQGAQFGSNTCDKEGKNGRVIILSHDWGGSLGWKMALWFPHRLMGVASCCVPFSQPSSTFRSIEKIIERLPQLGYQKFFADERSTNIVQNNLELFLTLAFIRDISIEEHGSWNLEGSLEKLLTSPESEKRSLIAAIKTILKREELDRYVQLFKSRGMEAPLSWYRTLRINWEEDQALTEKSLPLNFPALMLCPTDDIALPPIMGHMMKRIVPWTRVIEIPNSGHFVQQEKPDMVGSHFEEWVEDTVLPAERQGTLMSWVKSKL